MTHYGLQVYRGVRSEQSVELSRNVKAVGMPEPSATGNLTCVNVNLLVSCGRFLPLLSSPFSTPD